ncbi:hypothetical protein E2562_002407 [Oryza meyeriana var. granulata]|uniref:Uncharacterized protein n=1 Tax=Oryza meyeriana var. granulata TaxID=110450 RepID=A0A6G1BI34_9ORYZ|nr:hypothetical protein E2562_002407 [Oryza meyeriana var. granulata]
MSTGAEELKKAKESRTRSRPCPVPTEDQAPRRPPPPPHRSSDGRRVLGSSCPVGGGCGASARARPASRAATAACPAAAILPCAVCLLSALAAHRPQLEGQATVVRPAGTEPAPTHAVRAAA